MQIPEKINYNGIEYTVKEIDRLDAENLWGRTEFKHSEISLEKGLPKQVKEQTFIHELLHIAFSTIGLDWDRKKEEQAVRAWADNIYGILKQNNLLK